MFHFRRRVPSRLRERGARRFLCLSLSTELPFQAARWAEALLAALEQAERDVDARAELTGAEIDAILGEVARAALARMLAQQDDDARTEDDADARIAALEERITELRAAARRREYKPLRPEVEAAAEAMALPLPEPVPSALGRPAAGLLREIAEAGIAAEDGEPVETVGAPFAARFSTASVRRFAAAPVPFYFAFEKTAAAAASPDMRRDTEATGKLFLELMTDRSPPLTRPSWRTSSTSSRARSRPTARGMGATAARPWAGRSTSAPRSPRPTPPTRPPRRPFETETRPCCTRPA